MSSITGSDVSGFQIPLPVTTTETSTPFQAQWNSSNRHLEDTCINKITRVFFFVINYLIKKFILPATRISSEKIEWVRGEFEKHWQRKKIEITNSDNGTIQFKEIPPTYTLHPIEVKTPDGATIRGTHFQNN